MRQHQTRLLLCHAVIAVVAASCAVGPKYRKPDAPVPVAFKELWQAAVPSDATPRGAWWQSYGDDVLNSLESAAETANQSIRQADAHYRAALALVGESRATLFPQLGVAVSATRSSGGNGNATSSSTPVTAATVANSRRISATASWEVDLWGKLRRQLEESRSNAEASAGDLASARLSVEATLAADYMKLRALDSQLALLTATLTEYRRSLEITRNRYAAGVAASTDVTQAESQLASGEAQLAAQSLQRATLEHAIAILAGKTPEELTLSPAPNMPAMPALPSALPATLLQRRPDVAAAERRVAAANAAIGVARSAYFPDLTLSATGGYQNSAWQNIFSAPNRFWSVGPALAATVFDAGARPAQNAAARANYAAAVASYRQTVLGALQSADDALASLHYLADEQAAAERASAAAHKTLTATQNQYKAGTVSYLNVVIAESTSLAEDNNLIAARSSRLQAHVSLIEALGGESQAIAPR